MPNEQAVTVRIADAEEVTAAIQTTIAVVMRLAARVDALEETLRKIHRQASDVWQDTVTGAYDAGSLEA